MDFENITKKVVPWFLAEISNTLFNCGKMINRLRRNAYLFPVKVRTIKNCGCLLPH